MTISPDGDPTRRRRPALLAALAALAAVAVIATVVAVAVADRRSGGTGGTAAPAPSPARTTGRPAGSPAASCTPGEGPLREKLEFTAASGNTVPFSISYPADYWTSCATYPVLYALHGRDENYDNFMDQALWMRRAMDAGVLAPAVIVTPDSFVSGRWENTPAGPAEDNFITYLIPYVEQNYRVRPGAENRLLVGFSMGGHGALRFGLKYPELFAGVWSVDGAMSRTPQDYLQLVQGKPASAFHIEAVGGQANGERVQAAVDTLKGAGITIPYSYRDREHTFEAFVEEDEKAGWPAAKYLQSQLGRSM